MRRRYEKEMIVQKLIFKIKKKHIKLFKLWFLIVGIELFQSLSCGLAVRFGSNQTVNNCYLVGLECKGKL